MLFNMEIYALLTYHLESDYLFYHRIIMYLSDDIYLNIILYFGIYDTYFSLYYKYNTIKYET